MTEPRQTPTEEIDPEVDGSDMRAEEMRRKELKGSNLEGSGRTVRESRQKNVRICGKSKRWRSTLMSRVR